MKYAFACRAIYTFFLLFFTSMSAKGQTEGLNISVLLRSDVFTNPARIRLEWQNTAVANLYSISRKLKTEPDFTVVKPNLPGSVLAWTDSNVVAGVEYEYKIERIINPGLPTELRAYSYISSGISVDPGLYKGRLLLLVDSITAAQSETKPAIWQWKQDVAGEGWEVSELQVSPQASVASVKQRLIALNKQQNFRSVFLLGRVPVPYTGFMAPDGHGDHQGAWPSDAFYGDTVNVLWSDSTVNNPTNPNPRIRNVPGDGKFDVVSLPPIHLEIGRVDMRNLPMFNLSEAALIKRYLDKNHKFRTGDIKVTDRPLQDDQFPQWGFSATAWRSFSSLCRNRNITNNNQFGVCSGSFKNTLTNHDYLWSGIWGGGSYTSVGNFSANNFAVDSFRTVFTAFIGSYFGDWDSPSNNLLRASLANRGPILTTCWSGRPIWHFHHMGMGDCIGYAARLTMNNYYFFGGTYQSDFSRLAHIALLGDPTLIMHPIKKVTTMEANVQGECIEISWNQTTDTVSGYVVLRKAENDNRFERISHQIITGTSFRDSCPVVGQSIYMVRPVRLEISNTGTYWNYGIGAMDTLNIERGISVSVDSASGCLGAPLVLHAQPFGGGGLPLYQWFKNDTLISGVNGSICEFESIHPSDTVVVSMSSSATCFAGLPSILSSPMGLYGLMLPPQPSEILVNQNQLSCSDPGPWQWLMDGVPIGGATDSIYEISISASYQVISGGFCKDTSQATFVNYVSVPDSDQKWSGYSLHPNPVSQWLYVVSPQNIPDKPELEVYNFVGQRVLSPVYLVNGQVEVASLSPGVYTLVIRSGAGLQNLRFVKY